MPSDGASLLTAYRKVDAALVAKGAPPTAAPLLRALETFWLSGKLRLTLRKGRQIGWSTGVIVRTVAATCLFGAYDQARGTRGTVGLSSTRQKEADERLWGLERAFFDLGIKAKPRGDTIEVPGRPVIIQSFPSTSDVARGANSWAWFEDEMPAWRDGDGANPARERDAAILPTGAMHENFRVYSAGTPMGSGDFHAKLVDLGDTEQQCVFSGPSWYWNPTLTEARCRELQPDPILFAREFAAIPQDDGIDAFDRADVARMVREANMGTVPADAGCMVIDSSSGRGDGWAYACVQYADEPTDEPLYLPETDPERLARIRALGVTDMPAYDGGQPVRNPKHGEPSRHLFLGAMGCFEGQQSRTAFSAIVAHCAAVAHSCGVTVVYGDQHEAFSLVSEFSRHGLQFVERAWTLPAKVDAVTTARRLLREGLLVVQPGREAERLKAELMQLEQRFTSTGALTIAARRTGAGHADRASLVLLLARLESEGRIAGSPIARRGEVGFEDPYGGG